MSHLVFHIGEGCTTLNEQASEGVAKVMKSESPEAGVLDNRQEVPLDEVVWVEYRALSREGNT